MVLLELPFDFVPMFLIFSETLFVYNLNRQTDLLEDEINVPERTNFVKYYGRPIFYISILLYLLTLFIAFSHSFSTFIFVLFPIVIGVLYSIFRLKRFLITKNLLVGISWGTIPVVVGCYFNRMDICVLIFYLFFSVEFFINTIIFDVKDMKGDKLHKIRTLPNVIGLKRTKYLLYFVNTLSALFLLLAIIKDILSPLSYVLFFFLGYVFLYIFYSKENNKTLYYGIFVDGEFIFLGVLVFLVSVI